MSKYDGIKTAAELVREVKNHGLSTVQEDLNRAADIIGNSEIGELVRLANDIGRNNENGEPDPKGTWSSNRSTPIPNTKSSLSCAESASGWAKRTKL